MGAKVSRVFFLPLEGLLRGAAKTRASLYRAGVLRARALGVPVISVGNLTLGGTGKTPLVAHIARLLRDRGLHPAVLSRGYRGRYRERVHIVSDSQGIRSTAEAAGDEPYLLAQRLEGVPIVVSRERRLAGEVAAGRLGADVVILDDGFQHLKLRRDLDIVTVDCTDPFGAGAMPPAGRLREPPGALARAHAVVLTRAAGTSGPEAVVARIRRYNSTVPCFRCRIRPVRFWSRDRSRGFDLDAGRGRKAAVFCGIGNPRSFRATVEELGIVVTRWFSFRDHHRYTVKEMGRMSDAARSAGAELLLTTEKDAVRLPGSLPEALPVTVLEMAVTIDEAAAFESYLLSRVRMA